MIPLNLQKVWGEKKKPETSGWAPLMDRISVQITDFQLPFQKILQQILFNTKLFLS